MNSIQQLINKKEKNLLSVFFTAGFPKLNDTTKIIKALSDNNVDFIEVGLPFSDPLADGPTIQHSSDIALKNGVNLDVIFEQLQTIQQTNKTPLVLMGYVNQMLKYGEDAFCEKVKNCGIDTLIIPDLPMVEYENHYQKLFEKYGLSNVFLITPNTSEERIRKIDAYSNSFIYVVASANITGAKGAITSEQVAYFKRIKQMNLKSPLIVGFGISNNNTFTKVCEYVNGAIIGSAFIKNLETHGISGVGNFINTIKHF